MTEITVETTRIYKGNADELRRRFPDEWQQFRSANPGADDRDWLLDCLDNGGPELFEFSDWLIDYQFTTKEQA